MKKHSILLFCVLIGSALILGGCSTSINGGDNHTALTVDQIAAQAEEAGSVPFYSWVNECQYINPTVPTPQCDPKWNWAKNFKPRVTPVTTIWVKKDWGDITPTPITIELYKVSVDGFDQLVESKNSPTMTAVPQLSYNAAGGAVWGANVPGRHLYQFTGLDPDAVYKIKEVLPGDTAIQTVLNLPEGVDRSSVQIDGKIVVTPELERIEYANGGSFTGYYYIVRLQNIVIPADEKTALDVVKIWKDDSDEEGIAKYRPETLAFNLYAEAEGNVSEVNASAYTLIGPGKNGNEWTYRFENLPKRTPNGALIKYYAQEVEPENYKAAHDTVNPVEYITNTYYPDTPDTPHLPPIYQPPYVKDNKINFWIKKDWGDNVPRKNNQTNTTALKIIITGKVTLDSGEVIQVEQHTLSTPVSTSVGLLVYNADGTANLRGTAIPGRWVYQQKGLPVYYVHTDEKEYVISWTVEEAGNNGVTVKFTNAQKGEYELVLPEPIDRRDDAADGSLDGKVTITPQPDASGDNFVDNNRARVEYSDDWYYIVRFQNVLQK
ncbi:MAG: Cna B-type domain-containing protein [Treponema sp.]|jgi:hypothetical protein|nr:Cna B-type domain-containing protein [Treponema sp.]